jgi:peptide/nickel transport system permease protein
MIAMAVACNPRVLVADEPTTALDVTVQAEVLALLHTLQASTGLAILVVTHDWGVVADLCDHALVMYAGQVVEQGDVDTLYRNPRHPYTVGLLSANPHAAVARASRESDQRRDLPTIPGTVPAPADWPVSCHFAARCPLAEQQCRDLKVPLLDLSDTHASRCLRTDLVSTLGRPDE